MGFNEAYRKPGKGDWKEAKKTMTAEEAA